MKCPSCGGSHKRAYGMSCGSCGYVFKLDPKVEGKGDGYFLALIRKASSNDTYYFTPTQLYAAYCRKEMKSPLWPFVITGVFLIGAVVLTIAEGVVFALALLAIAVIALLVGLYRALRSPPDPNKLRQLITKWLDRGGEIEKLVNEPALHQPPPKWPESDIYDYGVERILVVQHDLLVDLFVRNGFHSQERAIVLSESGYPSYIVPLAQKAIGQNPNLTIFLLHDSTADGQLMEERLRNSGLLPLDKVTLIDLGLSPDDVKRLKRLRPLRPASVNYELAVDTLNYQMLAVGISACLVSGVALASLLEQQAAQGAAYESSTSFG